MIADYLPLTVIVGLMLVAIWFLQRKQVRNYKTYLDQHIEKSATLLENQRAIAETQIAATDRQTAALERIAESLEKRA